MIRKLIAIYAVGYVAMLAANRFRMTADDRSPLPEDLWVCLQWPVVAARAAPIFARMLKYELTRVDPWGM